MGRFKSLAIAAAVGSFAATSAAAELKNTYTSMTGPQLAAILRAKGYQADLNADSGGDPLIYSGTGGNRFAIWSSGCDKAAVRSCKMIEFRALFTNDKDYAPADANRCNNQYMYGRVEITNDGVAVTYGVPVINIDDDYIQAVLDEWAYLLTSYQTCMTKQRT
jgi:hypothetical protein